MLYLRFQTKLNLTDDTRSGEVDMNSVLRVMKTMTVDNLEDGMSVFFSFVERYVVKLYGKRAIAAWVKKNKGRSFLDMLTMSDVAYSMSIIENSCRVWDQDLSIEQLSKSEQEKYKPKVNKTLPDDEREKYIRVTPRFTDKNLRNRTYMKSGWSEEGINFYNSMWMRWKTIARDRDSLEKLQVGWELHAVDSDFGAFWKVSGVRASSEDERVLENEDDSPGNHFSLPGDDAFEEDRYASHDLGAQDEGVGAEPEEMEDVIEEVVVEEEEEEEEYDDDGEKDGHDDYGFGGSKKRKKSYGSDSESSDSSSDEEDDEEEEQPTKRRKMSNRCPGRNEGARVSMD